MIFRYAIIAGTPLATYFLRKRNGGRFKVMFISSNKATVSNFGTCLNLQLESGSVIFYLFRLRVQEKLPTSTDSESSLNSDATALVITVVCVCISIFVI